MDLLMKFDIELQIKKTLSTSDNRHLREMRCQYMGPNIPPIEIHLCCSNIRHKTCFKAFQTLELYLGYCVKKNCTLTNNQLSCENGKPLLSPEELKARLDPKQDPSKLHKSYFKL